MKSFIRFPLDLIANLKKVFIALFLGTRNFHFTPDSIKHSWCTAFPILTHENKTEKLICKEPWWKRILIFLYMYESAAYEWLSIWNISMRCLPRPMSTTMQYTAPRFREQWRTPLWCVKEAISRVYHTRRTHVWVLGWCFNSWKTPLFILLFLKWGKTASFSNNSKSCLRSGTCVTHHCIHVQVLSGENWSFRRVLHGTQQLHYSLQLQSKG